MGGVLNLQLYQQHCSALPPVPQTEDDAKNLNALVEHLKADLEAAKSDYTKRETIRNFGRDENQLYQTQQLKDAAHKLEGKIYGSLSPELAAATNQAARHHLLAGLEKQLEQTIAWLTSQKIQVPGAPFEMAGPTGNTIPLSSVQALSEIYTPAQEKERAVFDSRIKHLQTYLNTVKVALENPANQAPTLPETGPTSTTAVTEALLKVEAGPVIENMIAEHMQATLLTDPTYADRIEIEAGQYEVLKALESVPVDLEDPKAQEIFEHNQAVLKTAVEALHPVTPQLPPLFLETQSKLNRIEEQFPSFDPTRDVYGANTGKAIPPAFSSAFQELQGHLSQIHDRIQKQKELAVALSRPTLSKDQHTKTLTQYLQGKDTLKKLARDYNQFLMTHANNSGMSLLSAIKEDVLNSVVAFSGHLLKLTGAKPTAYRPFQPTISDAAALIMYSIRPDKLFGMLFNIFSKAYNNQDSNTIVGGNYKLTSNADMLDKYDMECSATSWTGHPILHGRTYEPPLKDNKGNDIILPAFGVNHADPQKVAGFSIMAVAQEVFGDEVYKHVSILHDDNGEVKGVRVTWKNKDQKEKYLKAVKERNEKYVEFKEQASKEIKATINTKPANEVTAKVATRPSFIDRTAGSCATEAARVEPGDDSPAPVTVRP